QRALEAAHVLGLANDRAARPGHRGAQALERGQRSRADDSVGRLAHVELELGDRVGGPGAEDAVLLADLEAERVEAPLELADVVAPERGGTQVQDAVPQTVAGLDELAPGLAPDHAVRREPSLLLERSDDGPNLPSSSSASIRYPSSRRRCWTSRTASPVSGLRMILTQPQYSERSAGRQLNGRSAGETLRVESAQLEGGRWGSISRRSASFPRAPTTRAISFPSLKSMSVGMLMTPYRRVTSGFSSTFSLATWRASPFSRPISSTTGETMWHGTHHSAQKSTSTGWFALRTRSSKS